MLRDRLLNILHKKIDMQYDYRTELIAALRKEFDNLVFNTNELLEEGDINVNR